MTAIVKKKICMLGSFGVGKTSLVRRYVSGIYSEKYMTTVGVKVDKKVVHVDGVDVTLMLWDLAGEDVYAQLNMNYLRGMAGYILVVDGTRRQSLAKAIDLHDRCLALFPQAVALGALNKQDLDERLEVSPTDIAVLEQAEVPVFRTSAKTAKSVENLFSRLATLVIERKPTESQSTDLAQASAVARGRVSSDLGRG